MHLRLPIACIEACLFARLVSVLCACAGTPEPTLAAEGNESGRAPIANVVPARGVQVAEPMSPATAMPPTGSAPEQPTPVAADAPTPSSSFSASASDAASGTPMPVVATPVAPAAAAAAPKTDPNLFWLDIYSDTLSRAHVDGSNARTLLRGKSLQAPDGVAVDPEQRAIYVLNMGARSGANLGSLVRVDLDGGNAQTIVPPGASADGEVFNTGKQVVFDAASGKLYLADREGSKVWRVNRDGSGLEVLVSRHDVQQIVGIAVDPGKHFYFTDRNGRKVYRAGVALPQGETHASRSDVELLVTIAQTNAMPLDMELDLQSRQFFWTDRLQHAVFRASMDMPSGQDAMTRNDVVTVAKDLGDVIGIAMDPESKRIYVTHRGALTSFLPDGSDRRETIASASTGIAFARIAPAM